MSAKAICKINIGDMYQTVYIENEKYDNKKTLEHHSVLLTKLPSFFVELNDVNDIYISGVSKEFGMSIEKETRMLQYQKYNKDNKTFHYI